MCIVCVEYEKGKMTPWEALNVLREIYRSDTDDDILHIEVKIAEFEEAAEDEEDDA